jgi:Glucose / Sorbosone dehydrogenase
MKRVAGALVLGLAFLGAGSAEAATLQAIGSFDQPIYVTSAPENPDRLFVVEREGRILEVEGTREALYADLTALVGCGGDCAGERGLLSIALPPDFAGSGRLYADYAAESDEAVHVVELHSASAGTAVVRPLLTIPHPGEGNHYGGQLQFGPEGNLFISTGDGGGSDDQHENAQDLNSLLGKILRIDPNRTGVLPYTVPAGNPFPGLGEPSDTIWSYGLRNPFRFSFDRGSGALAIGDVGQGSREEVDLAPFPGLGAGANYGWNCREGFLAETVTPEAGCATATSFTDPIFDYPHEDPGEGGAHGCAIIGGYVARDSSLGDLAGRYLYGDLCVGELRSFLPAAPAASDRSEGIQVEGLNSFGEDSCGRLYVVSGFGTIWRVVGAAPASCAPTPPPLAFSFAGIRASSRVVEKGRRVLLTAWVSPCAGRQGQPISLLRGRRKLGTRHLDKVCSARFRPRISRRSKFRATVNQDSVYEAATSRKLTVKPRPRRRR